MAYQKDLTGKILKFLEHQDNFMISAHVNADGDAVASVIAVYMLLERLGKNSVMILHDEKVDNRFNYLKYFDRIRQVNGSPELNIEAAVILDVPGVKRLGDVAGLLPDRTKIVKIDHHPPEDDFAGLSLVDEDASSTTQLIFDIVDQAGIPIDVELAKAIYTGIVYDTGRFSFSNTRAHDMFIGGKMIERGISPSEINNRIFFENSFNALRTIGRGLSTLESYFEGKVNVIYLDYLDMNNGYQAEIEELANYSVAIRGGEVGLFIREIKPGLHKVSFRSKSDVDVNQVAKAFDGGGHARAAGCRIEGDKQEVLDRVLAELRKWFK
jgi:phosphoesterase RecJ-like protein